MPFVVYLSYQSFDFINILLPLYLVCFSFFFVQNCDKTFKVSDILDIGHLAEIVDLIASEERGKDALTEASVLASLDGVVLEYFPFENQGVFLELLRVELSVVLVHHFDSVLDIVLRLWVFI